LGLTTIYVTHDQEEALAMSTRVAVMNPAKGCRRTAHDYEQPAHESSPHRRSIELVFGRVLRQGSVGRMTPNRMA
jgi:ABC-type sugar transport system ATPase subunit